MGSYIQITDLEERIKTARLAKFVPETGTERTGILTNIITRAESRIDGFLGGRYTIPLAVTGYLQEMALVIAEYEIYRRTTAPDVPEKIRKAFDDATKELKGLAAGDWTLGGQDGPAPAASDGGIAVQSEELVLGALDGF
jgi:phage gp36-like protein